MLRRARRPAGERDPRRQQRARPRDRPPRGQAHAGGAARARRARATLYAAMLARRVRDRAAAVAARVADARGCCCRWLALPLAVRARAHRAHAHRRAVAERRAGAAPGMLQLLFCVLLSAGHPRELMDGSRSRARRCALRRRRCATAYGELAERELLAAALDGERRRRRLRRGGAARALRRRVARARAARRSSATRPVAARRRRPRRRASSLDACRAVDRPAAGAGRGRPRAVGPRRPPRGHAGGASC